MAKLFANSENPDQTPHSAASDLDLLCLLITCLGSSDYNWLRRPSTPPTASLTVKNGNPKVISDVNWVRLILIR